MNHTQKKIQKKTSKKRRIRQQAVIVILAVLIVCAAAGIWLWKLLGNSSSGSSYSSSGSSSDKTVEYEGKTYRYNDHLSNYLFMGIDTRDEMGSDKDLESAGQADAIYLVSLDRAKNTLQVLSIPRDTITEIETFNPSGKSLGMSKDHINVQYGFGDGRHESCELMEAAVSRLLYDTPIQGYAAMNMDGIPVLTDILGGVDVVIPDDSLEEVNPEFKEGAEVTLTKDNVEQFVRYRDIETSQSAIVRQERQKTFLNAYMEKAQELSLEDPSLVTRLYEGVQDYLVTGMGNDLFAKLLEASAQEKPSVTTIPGEGVEGKYYDEFHVDQDALYELVLQMFYEGDS